MASLRRGRSSRARARPCWPARGRCLDDNRQPGVATPVFQPSWRPKRSSPPSPTSHAVREGMQREFPWPHLSCPDALQVSSPKQSERVRRNGPPRHSHEQCERLQSRPVRDELLVRIDRHHGAGAVARDLGGQSRGRAACRYGRPRFSASGRALAWLRRAHGSAGHLVRDPHLGDRASCRHSRHRHLRDRAHGAHQSGVCCQAGRYR